MSPVEADHPFLFSSELVPEERAAQQQLGALAVARIGILGIAVFVVACLGVKRGIRKWYRTELRLSIRFEIF